MLLAFTPEPSNALARQINGTLELLRPVGYFRGPQVDHGGQSPRL